MMSDYDSALGPEYRRAAPIVGRFCDTSHADVHGPLSPRSPPARVVRCKDAFASLTLERSHFRTSALVHREVRAFTHNERNRR